MRKILPRDFPVPIILIWSCHTKQSDSKPAPLDTITSISHFHIEHAKEAESSEEKIAHLNKALLSIDDLNDTLVPILLDQKIYYHGSLKQYDSAFYFANSLGSWQV